MFISSLNIYFATEKRCIESKASQFVGHGQNDSLEFLTYLLDEMHRELASPVIEVDWSEKFVKRGSALEENVQVGKYFFEFSCQKVKFIDKKSIGEQMWSSYLRVSSSFVSKNFHFMLLRTTLCLECDSMSLKFDLSSSLTLPVPCSQKFNKKNNKKVSFKKIKNFYKK